MAEGLAPVEPLPEVEADRLRERALPFLPASLGDMVMTIMRIPMAQIMAKTRPTLSLSPGLSTM